MAKKHVGRFLTFAAIAGAAVAGISYFLQYKSFHKELDEEFHDFEDDFEEFEDTNDSGASSVTRNYVSLTPEKKAEGAQESPAEKNTADEKIPAPSQDEAAGSVKEAEQADSPEQTKEPNPESPEEKKENSQSDTTVTVEEMTE